MRKVFLAIPSHSCQITAPTALSIAQAIDEARQGGFGLEMRCQGGDADIARARNVLIGEFLKGDYTDFWGLDADVSCAPGTLPRMMGHGVDFAAGVYRLRTDEVVAYPVHWPRERRMITSAIGQPLLEAELVPGGFLLLSRACIEKMAAVPGERWVEAGDDPVAPELRYPFLFDWMWHGRKRRSEDYTFCLKWRGIGGEIFVDPTINLGHSGFKTFDGTLIEHLALEAQAARQVPANPPLLDRARQMLSAPPG